MLKFPPGGQVIGIDEEGIEEITHSETVRDVLMLDDSQTAVFTQKYSLRREETRKFCLFLHNLHRCVTDKKNNKVSGTTGCDLYNQLYLDIVIFKSSSSSSRFHEITTVKSLNTFAIDRNMVFLPNYSNFQCYQWTNQTCLKIKANDHQGCTIGMLWNVCKVINVCN